MITSYETLPVGKYLAICEATENIQDASARNEAIVAILNGITTDELQGWLVQDVVKAIGEASFLLSQPQKRGLAKGYNVGGFTLVPCTDMRKMTTAQFTDYKELGKRCKDISDPRMLSCLLVPKGHKYCDDYDADDVTDAIREQMCVLDALALSAFFLDSQRKYARAILFSSLNRLRRMKRMRKVAVMLKQLQTSMTSGDGLTSSVWCLTLPTTLGAQPTSDQ